MYVGELAVISSFGDVQAALSSGGRPAFYRTLH